MIVDSRRSRHICTCNIYCTSVHPGRGIHPLWLFLRFLPHFSLLKRFFWGQVFPHSNRESKDRECRLSTDCKALWGKLWFVNLGYTNTFWFYLHYCVVLWEAAYPPLHGQMQEKGLQHLERPHPPYKHIVSPPPLRQEAAEHQRLWDCWALVEHCRTVASCTINCTISQNLHCTPVTLYNPMDLFPVFIKNTVEWSHFVPSSSNLKHVFTYTVPTAPYCHPSPQMKPQAVIHPEKHFWF